MTTLRDLVELVRAPAALSVPGDVIAGAAAAGVLGPATPALAAASVCLYWAGMAANDWADRELDAVERPERPIPSGRVSPSTALGVAVGLTAAGLAVAGLTGGRRALAVAVPLAGSVWAYDLYWKNTKAGPVAMSACRALDVLLGGIGQHKSFAITAFGPAAIVAAHTYTVTALSRREVHGADRALPAATLAGTAAIAAITRRGASASGLAGWYASGYGLAQLRAVVDPSAERVREAVGAGITSLPALQGALAARAGAKLVGLLVAAAAPLARRLSKGVSPT